MSCSKSHSGRHSWEWMHDDLRFMDSPPPRRMRPVGLYRCRHCEFGRVSQPRGPGLDLKAVRHAYQAQRGGKP